MLENLKWAGLIHPLETLQYLLEYVCEYIDRLHSSIGMEQRFGSVSSRDFLPRESVALEGEQRMASAIDTTTTYSEEDAVKCQEPCHTASERHDESLGFMDLFESQSLVDVDLLTSDGTCISAHKVVLAAHSPYFRAMFAGASSNMIENARSCVHVEHVDGATLRMLLKIVYSALPDTSAARCAFLEDDIIQKDASTEVPKLLGAASYLSVQSVMEVSSDFLRAKMHVGNVVDILLLAERYDCVDVYIAAKMFLKDNLGSLLRSKEGARSLCVLSRDFMLDALSVRAGSPCLYREADVLSAAILWARDSMDKKDDVVYLLDRSEIVFYSDELDMACQLLKDLKTQEGEKEPFVQDELIEHVRQYIQGSLVSSSEPSMNYSYKRVYEMCPDANGQIHREYWGETQLIASGGICNAWQSLRSTEIYDVVSETWSRGPDMPLECSFGHACKCANGQMYIAGKFAGASLLQYMPEESQWHIHQNDSSYTPRVNSACVSLGNDVFVLGGRATQGKDRHPGNLNECFESSTGTWKKLAPMNHYRASLDACAVYGRIWCIGGQSLRQTHDTMEWYEPERDAWFISSARMSVPRKYATVTTIRGNIIVIGGLDSNRTRLCTVEAYDPRAGKWRQFESLPETISSAASCVLNNESAFVAGGRVGYDGTETNRMFWYSIRTDRWNKCTSMNLGARANFALASF